MITVVEMLAESARKYPDKVAVSDGSEQITYQDMYNYCKKLAYVISLKVSEPRSPIMVFSNRSIWSVVAFWAVALSGNAYFSVDAGTPRNRMEKYVEIANPSLIINVTSKDLPINVNTINIHDVDFNHGREIAPSNFTIDLDPLYLVFTSGSTGLPKAVVKSHRSIITFVESFTSIFKINYNDVMGNQAMFDFDVSAKDIYLSAYTGCTLFIIPNICFSVPSMLSDFLRKNEITTLIWAAAAVKYVSRMNCFRDAIPESITKVFFSGESMPIEVLNYWRNALPKALYVNLYAPSEITGNCLYHIANDDDKTGIMPLTDTFPNTEVLILDEKKAISDNMKGEIYVRGAFMSSGYYGDRNLTDTSFIQNPLHNNYIDIVYKTGDFVLKKDNKLFFMGREDNQIKRMGHRVELEDIEQTIISELGLEEGCAVYDRNTEMILFFGKNMDEISKDNMESIKRIMPKYMIPDKMICVSEISYNERGKKDRSQQLTKYLSENQ